MVQGVGYLLAALGPITAGVLRDLTGQFTLALWFAALISVGQLTLGLFAGRDRYTHAH